ncbi:unnamed protein product [Mytilus coruscus]|uniref:HTH psq-type domain-containing protein n=1 Tax=Mytilus coruscus TaxID=42192 RepID=A0A6J8AXF9_MYTCO|nr:unnamed protein product [Mytilus coruscus]
MNVQVVNHACLCVSGHYKREKKMKPYNNQNYLGKTVVKEETIIPIKDPVFKVFQSQCGLSLNQKQRRGPKPKSYRREDLDKAVETVLAGKMTQTQAALFYGVPQPSIGYQSRNNANRRWRRDYKPQKLEQAIAEVLAGHSLVQPERRLLRKQGPKKEYSPKNMEMAIKAVIEGKMTQSQASREYGVPQPTISFKIQIRRSKGRIGFYKPQNLEKAILAVITGKLNQSQAADKFDVTQSTISRRLRKMKSQLTQEHPTSVKQSQLDTQSNLKPP